MTYPTTFTLLEAEWAELASTPLPVAWRHDAALESHRTLADLMTVTERRGDPAASDRVLAALAHRASGIPGDELAARTLLQMLLPGAKALARRMPWLGDHGERAAAVTACLYERIRTYPFDRRPARIAANLLGDTRQRLLHTPGGGARPVEVSLESLAEQGMLAEPPRVGPSAAEELLGLLVWAVSGGHLTRAQAYLIGQSRIGGTSCDELGAMAGLGAHSFRRRRQRAERALKMAVRGHGGAQGEIPGMAGRVADLVCAWPS